MKRFNEVITVEVSVDAIAEQLLNAMSKEYLHAELVTETIIGNLLRNKGESISQVFNALNGYTNEIDFSVGDMLIANEHAYTHVPKDDGTFEEVYQKIGLCTIEDIDLYSNKKLKVSYEYTTKDGKVQTRTSQISHLKCTKYI